VKSLASYYSFVLLPHSWVASHLNPALSNVLFAFDKTSPRNINHHDATNVTC
jgi:hypothetical protein